MSGRPQRDGNCVIMQSSAARIPPGVRPHRNRAGRNQLNPFRTGCPRSREHLGCGALPGTCAVVVPTVAGADGPAPRKKV